MTSETGSPKYKFRDLKVYSSTEWLADNKKKYRQVFDRFEVGHIFVELSFHNKGFDVEDWTAQVELKCFSVKKTRKELCTLSYERKISRYDHIVYVREGWGNPKVGSFWKKGSYLWEAHIDGVHVGSKYFYIEETNPKNRELDLKSYLKLKSAKLYESDYDDKSKEERSYHKVFSKNDTRYVNVEILFENKLRTKTWYCELIVKFYNSARQLKGQSVKLQHIERRERDVEITANLGSNIRGSWSEDSYTAEIIFMDKLLAIIPFEVGEQTEEGLAPLIEPNIKGQIFSQSPTVLQQTEEDFAKVMEDLDELIGLQELKQQIRDHANYISFLQLRRDKGFEEKEAINIHSVFSGNPGTGKTTVAKMMGRLYKAMGLLSKGHVHEVDRVDLVGEYIGQTAPKVKEAIKKARGGVLFIDEAYALARANDDSKDFGREVIEILVKEMSNGPGDLALIVAGYPKEMKYFIDSNPGFKSRFKLYFDFPDYLPEELSQIAALAAKKKSVLLNPEASLQIDEYIIDAYRKRNRSFGNARFVFNLIEQAKLNMGLRIMSNEEPEALERETLELILAEDTEKINLRKRKRLAQLPIDERLLKEALFELHSLIGMQNIKKEIEELVRLVRFYKESKRNVLNKFYLHTVFIGNPGTGKTTVARILTKIYKALGVLERGHMVETDRQGLVAGYVGQTAIKTAERIDEAMGGVLFIDEAYALTSKEMGNQGGSSDFGNEAIQTLLKRMEDKRGEFFVFVAGYPDNMESFLKANPGLKSRFDKFLKFEDYSAAELMQIAELMLSGEEMQIEEDAKQTLCDYLESLYRVRDKYFGNARTVRTVVNEIVKNQTLRLASMNPAERPKDKLNWISREDLTSLKLSNEDALFNRKTIGFREGQSKKDSPDSLGSAGV